MIWAWTSTGVEFIMCDTWGTTFLSSQHLHRIRMQHSRQGLRKDTRHFQNPALFCGAAVYHVCVKYCCKTGWRKRNPGAAFILRGEKYQFHTATWLLLFQVSLSYYSSPTRLSTYKKNNSQLFVKYLAWSFIFCTIYLYYLLSYTVILLNCVFDVTFTV